VVSPRSPDASATKEDLGATRRLFSSVGSAVVVPEEDLDTVTAVSEQRPRLRPYLMLEALMQGGIEAGLSEERVADLRLRRARRRRGPDGGIRGNPPSPCVPRCASPGGTTAAGLQVSGGFRLHDRRPGRRAGCTDPLRVELSHASPERMTGGEPFVPGRLGALLGLLAAMRIQALPCPRTLPGFRPSQRRLPATPFASGNLPWPAGQLYGEEPSSRWIASSSAPASEMNLAAVNTTAGRAGRIGRSRPQSSGQ